MNNKLLILTVGTGTAGKDSNLAQGLVATLKKIQPRKYWLVPSVSEDSQAMAGLISQECPESFVRCLAIERPDDIYSCRETVRAAIREAKELLQAGEGVLVNPTSGTKQMSAGAALAALDEEVGDLVFTVGERQDGVVKTGTETIVDFPAAQFFFERDVRIAQHLFDNGSFWAAAELMKRYPGREASRLRNTALCAHEWLRQNYAKAAARAALLDENLRRHLSEMAGAVASDQPHPAVLADIVDMIGLYLRWNDAEEALGKSYKALEYAARLRVAGLTGLSFPLEHKRLMALPVSERLKQDLRINQDGSCTPGLSLVLRLLDELGDDLPRRVYGDHDLKQLPELRNRCIHDVSHADSASARHIGGKMVRLLGPPPRVGLGDLKFEI
ncbi:MAG: hypothetical protein V2A34_09685 [Lentisphaerota bacterium]